MRCDRVVLVFARLPHEERHAKPLIPGAAGHRVEALHRGLLRRALAAARAVGVDARLVTTSLARPPVEFPALEVAQQIDGTFAERLERAVADAFAAGWREVVVIGGDTPGLQADHLRDAFASLGAAPGRGAVVGPAVDGGYYLLALNAFDPAAFRGVGLGTPDAGRATQRALAAAGFTVTTLPPLRDVDTHADVRALAHSHGELRPLALLLVAPAASVVRPTITPPTLLRPTSLQPRGPPPAV